MVRSDPNATAPHEPADPDVTVAYPGLPLVFSDPDWPDVPLGGGGVGEPHVAPNGDTVVFQSGYNGNYHTCGGGMQYYGFHSIGVYRWRNGVSTPVSAGLMGYLPRIDPTQVAFATLEGSIYLARGGAPVLLATLSPPPGPPLFYEVNGGWAAFE